LKVELGSTSAPMKPVLKMQLVQPANSSR